MTDYSKLKYVPEDPAFEYYCECCDDEGENAKDNPATWKGPGDDYEYEYNWLCDSCAIKLGVQRVGEDGNPVEAEREILRVGFTWTLNDKHGTSFEVGEKTEVGVIAHIDAKWMTPTGFSGEIIYTYSNGESSTVRVGHLQSIRYMGAS